MEHRLITGGWEYLPFARNRIQQLRAAGLTHTTDRKVFADAVVTVRIVGEQEFIHIQGGGCTLPMDSGVVDVGVYASSSDPARFLAGTLHESQALAFYNASFVPDGSWRLNPGKKSAGQLSGLLTGGGGFRGKVPYDHQRARSFAPKKIQDGDDWIDDSADNKLPAKKTAAMRCPASMFTGKARLYAQAMFGQYMYPPERLGSMGEVVGASDEALIAPEFNDTAPPSLLITAYKAKSDESSYPAVVMNTNSGVHLDAAGKHWFFEVNNDEVIVHPLIGSPCAEGLRKYLVQDAPNDPLSAEDRERLEAYILASCRPWVKNKVRIPLNLALVAYSMGYGWHWNWSGTQCDMVVNNTFEQGGSAVGMRSTHYRITFSRLGGLWQAVVSVVEGPVDWTVLRPIWVITEPSWINQAPLAEFPTYTLIKTTFRTTTQIACDAPFYCFYARDELKVCRVRVANNPATPPGLSFTPGFRTDDGLELRYGTIGLDSGYSESHTGYSAHWEAQFSCGGESFSGLLYNKVGSGLRIQVVDKAVEPGEPTLLWGSTVDNWEFEKGYPPYDIVRYRGFFSFKASRPVRYKIQYFDYVDNYQSRAAIVVPFYDAEAVYFQAECKLLRSKTDGMSQTEVGGRFLYRNQPKFEDGSTGPISEIFTSSDNTFNAVIEPFGPFIPADEETYLVNAQRLVHRAGAVDAIYGADLDGFFDNEGDRVGATFKTLSSTAASQPVVIGRCAPVGTDVHEGNVALVGAI
jgi:hypothetical protein